MAECNINIKNLEEAIVILESINEVSSKNISSKNMAIFRYKTQMLICSVSINLGDYGRAITLYSESEKEILDNFQQPELNLKLASVYLNIGICYIYLSNFNNAERYLKKGLGQTEGLLGNDIVYKVNFLIFIFFFNSLII